MDTSYSIYTVTKNNVTLGTRVQALVLKSAGISIPAVIVGEEGRGRVRGVLPVNSVSPLDDGSYPSIVAASIATTQAGKPKLVARDIVSTREKVIIVFRTSIGFRGGNSHTGDYTGWTCRACGNISLVNEPVPEVCPCGCGSYRGPELTFEPFPGEIIARGRIAQGKAGNAGSGEQIIALMPQGVVFRVALSGRLYGNPSTFYGRWDGEQLVVLTRTERDASDLF